MIIDAKNIARYVGIPLAAAGVLAGAILLRSSPAPESATRAPSAGAKHPAIFAPAPVGEAPRPAPPEKIAAATEVVRIHGTYENYRRAVVSNNEGLQKVLLPVLLKDREAARQCAQDDLGRAQTESDRQIARKVIQDLGR